MAEALTRDTAPKMRTAKRHVETAAADLAQVRDPLASKRAALVERLKAKADAADHGGSVSLAGLNDDQLIAALTCR